MKITSPASLLLSFELLSRRCTSGFVLPSASSSVTSATATPYVTHRSSTTGSGADDVDGDSSSTSTAEIAKAPTLNGKVVLPVKALTAGLRGHKVAAVYAILDSNYKRG